MTEIAQLFPHPGTGRLDHDELLALYTPLRRGEPRLRVNFIESLDGSATLDGLSGGLGAPADKEVFDILRGLADVVLVGAGTARAEGYGALTVDAATVARRRAAGLSDHPAMALVSGRLDFDPASALFAEAPTKPLVFTTANAPVDARGRLAGVADVIEAGTDRVEAAQVVRALHERGLVQILCEGGPSLFGELIAEDLVDEFCLTLSPVLEGGSGPRITRAAGPSAPDPSAPGPSAPVVPRGMELGHLLHSGSMILTRWVRGAAA
ncbi:pyrimidine reductase family protein [Herbiconiux solani]|uniref:pyrimidine reductase family protein n=1 Tax=Herbiconiux solani TaxID=661329 RepID=UPI0008263BF0|nr:pyrimidine reductase family protein [Herbiconiux solani]